LTIETSEHVQLLAALHYYSRLRFITNLLPLLQDATSVGRIVTVAGGGHEGPLDPTDFPALRVPLLDLRGHLSTLISLGLEAVARTAPEVSFVHDYPGTVNTPLSSRMKNVPQAPIRRVDAYVPVEESGERHLYLATSARFPSVRDRSAAGDGVGVALGTTT
jgi:hypothetical protein